MKKAINSFWYDKWTNEKQIKSTLTFLEIQQNPIGTPHNISRSVKNRKYDIQKAEIKLRLITDTYMLQYHHAKFSRNKISPICKLCGEEENNRVYFLLECKTLEKNRKTQMVKLGEALEEARGGGGGGGGGTRTIEQNGLLMQIILDCTSYKINQLISYSNQDLAQIERATQHYCFVLHQKRTEILKNII